MEMEEGDVELKRICVGTDVGSVVTGDLVADAGIDQPCEQ